MQARCGWHAVGEVLADLREDRRGVHHVGHREDCTVRCVVRRGRGIDYDGRGVVEARRMGFLEGYLHGRTGRREGGLVLKGESRCSDGCELTLRLEQMVARKVCGENTARYNEARLGHWEDHVKDHLGNRDLAAQPTGHVTRFSE